MKRKIKVYQNGQYVEKEITYIPIRYIISVLLTIIEILLIIGVMVVLAIFIPYFYIAILLTVIGVVIQIIASNENPDYKIPWLLFVIVLPIVGFMLYLMFHQRKLPRRFVEKFNKFDNSLIINDNNEIDELKNKDELAYSQAYLLSKISNTHLYKNTQIKYFPSGELMFKNILNDLKNAEKFILLEYFIIENGIFWNSILDILIEKAKQGVEVKLIYDDIGCMNTLPGNYYKQLRKYNIEAVLFSKLKGQANGEFNNRSHRKILVIDSKVSYTGGINIADEYINEVNRFGYWKDTGIRLEGSAVNELTKLFLTDYYINLKKDYEIDFNRYYIDYTLANNSYIVPFGDGPNPIYKYNVGKMIIINMLNHATDYVYITTPYLITDKELMSTIENTALRGVKVKIIVPHIPDKKMVFAMTKSNYRILIKSGVEIYEYESGFIHSKLYIVDDKTAMIGTINLDYRSLTHHFENGVWIYKDNSIIEMRNDFDDAISKSIYMNDIKFKDKLLARFIRSIVRIFSPLL